MTWDMENELSTLREENKQLKNILRKIKEKSESGVNILASVDFSDKDSAPHRAIRLYTENGKALGFGEFKVNDTREDNLFERTGMVNFRVKFELETLLKEV